MDGTGDTTVAVHRPHRVVIRFAGDNQGPDHAVLGVIRQVVRPTCDDLTRAEAQQAVDGGGDRLVAVLQGPDTSTVCDGAVSTGAVGP